MLHKKYKSSLYLIFVISMALAANTSGQIYVDAGATGANDGTSWADAYIDLQDALDEAVAGKEIWVAAGIYKPSKLEASGESRSATFQLISGVALLGGFGGETILSGDIGNVGESSDNCYHVVTGSYTDISAVIEGFTIEDGYADGPWDIDGIDPPERYDQGAGMFNFEGGPTVNHCIFRQNYALWGGGAVENRGADSNPIFNYCTFNDNTAEEYYGGAMFNTYCNLELNHCEFNGNTAVLGGGMNNSSCEVVLRNCEFNSNFAEIAGGGTQEYSSNSVFINCKFHDNTAQNLNGGGVQVELCNPELIDCEFHGNFALYGGGMAAGYLCDAKLSNCEFHDNSAEYYGGGLIAYMSNPELIDCKFNHNTAGARGGGMHIFVNSSPVLSGCKFNDNSAPSGAGMFNDTGCNPELTDCTFNGNFADNQGGGLYNAGSPILTDCSFQGNHSGDLGGGMASGSGGLVTLLHCLLWGNTAANAVGEFAQIYDDYDGEDDWPVINFSCIQGWTGDFGGTVNTGKKSEYIK